MDGKNFHDYVILNIFPTRFPSINLTTGYYECSVAKRDSNRNPHKTVLDLKAAVGAQWQTFPTHIWLLPAFGFDSS